MKNLISLKIKNYFSGHERSVKLKKNIFATFLLKAISIITGFLMVPICLNYLDKTRYGIWLTVSSFIIWFTFFEIGLGSGLRNKLAESLAIKDFRSAKIYVSTTYAILSIIVFFMMALFIILNRYIDWVRVFNTDRNLSSELSLLIQVIFFMFFLRFILKLITIVLYADQRPALASSINTFGNLIALIVIYLLSKTMQSSLLYLGLALSISPVIVLIIFNVYLFSGKYSNFSPSYKYVEFKYAKELVGLGVKFFIIQICGLVLYQSSNFIISHFLGPAEVTPYVIVYKLFSIMSMIFAIMITPFWSAFTEAWKNQDIPWIKRSVRKLFKAWLVIALVGLLVLLFSNKIYFFWVGDSVQISFKLSTLIYIYFLIFTFGGIFNMFINGVGKIRLQLFCAILGSIIFIPLSIVLINKFHLGIEGLVIAMIIVNFHAVIITPIQFWKIINNKAYGIWNK